MTYDSLIITNISAFYKINLFNEVAKKSKIFVVFVAKKSSIRTFDFTAGDIFFEHIFLSEGAFEGVSIGRLAKALEIIYSVKHKRLIVCGWDMLEYWMYAFISPKKKNIVLVESSEYEGARSGLRLWLKKLFVSRISKAIVSGKSQENLMRNLYFEGECVHGGGVGIFRKPKVVRKERKFSGKFLFVGRLSHEKNIHFLLDIFARLADFTLTIAGTGSMEAELRLKATRNIVFIGHIPNDKMEALYGEHDVLLLPSLIEPWGLVVEEAVYHGMPVIVSDRVGCAAEIVLEPKTGRVLELNNEFWIATMTRFGNKDVYNDFVENCYGFDFNIRDNMQVEAFIER